MKSAQAEIRLSGAEGGLQELSRFDREKLGTQMEQLAAQIAATRERLSRLTVRAPTDGVVLTEQMERLPGAFVREGDQIMELADLKDWRVLLSVSERDVKKVPLLRGRWFKPEDDALGYVPVVIDSDLAKALFGDEDPIGQKFDEKSQHEQRVIGIMPPFRKNGEFTGDKINMAFIRASLAKKDATAPASVIIRVRPGTPAAFEESISRRTHEIFPAYEQRVRRMEAMRTFAMRIYLIPVVAGTIIAAFLITMVALGLSGVLWQNVTRRTREIGLRRALGATGNEVNRQILLEVALLATLALIVGVILVAQLPLLGIFRLVSPASFTIGFAGALATINGLTLL